MTISSTTNRVIITGNGITVDIPFPYAVHTPETDLIVIATVIATGVQATKTSPTHWTWAGSADGSGHYPNGGTVTALVAPPSTETWTVYRDPVAAQGLDLVANDDLPAEATESQFDYLTMLIQRVKDQINRTLQQPEGDAATISRLPAKVERASMFLAFDTDGDPIAAAGTSADLTPVSSFINTLLDDADAATARATLGITATSNADSDFRVVGSADGTKKLAFEVDGLTTATTRTVTIQDQSGTMALRQTIASYTGTDTLAAGVGVGLLSGASFVLTLPAAASHTNREVTLIHQGTSLTQVYTIKGNGAEDLIAKDGTGNSFILYTAGEEITVKSNGTGWLVLNHIADTAWVDAGVMTITGTTSNPTKPTTPDYDHVFWRREGKDALVRWVLQISSSAGAADGSGTYLYATPSGVAIDAVLAPVGTAWATATMSEGIRAGLSGGGRVVLDSSSLDILTPFAYDTTHVQFVRHNLAAAISSAGYAMTTAELGYFVEARFPAANWRV